MSMVPSQEAVCLKFDDDSEGTDPCRLSLFASPLGRWWNAAGKDVVAPGARKSIPDERFALSLAKARAEGRKPDDAELETLRKQIANKRK